MKLENVFEYFQQHPVIFDYLPDAKDIRKTPRSWVFSIASTVIGQPFRDWVAYCIKERNEAIVREKNLGVNLDPSIYAAF